MYWLMCSKHISYHKIEVIWERMIFFSSTNCFPINVDRTSFFFCKLSLPSFSVASIMDVIYGSIICQLSKPLRRSSIPIKQYFYLTNFWQSCQFICMCMVRQRKGSFYSETKQKSIWKCLKIWKEFEFQ